MSGFFVKALYSFNNSIRPLKRTLTGTITPGKSETGRKHNEGILGIPLMLHSQIWVCEIFIYVKKRSQWFTFLSLRFFEMRRKRHNFFQCWLFVHRQLSTLWLNHVRPPPQTTGLASASSENRLSSSRHESQLCLFSNPKILSSSLPGMTSFTSPVLFTIWGFYFNISDCHIHPRVREHLHSMCALN